METLYIIPTEQREIPSGSDRLRTGTEAYDNQNIENVMDAAVKDDAAAKLTTHSSLGSLF